MKTLPYEDFKSWKDRSVQDAIKFKEDVIEVSIHIIFTKDDNDFMNAHALEFDIVAEGKTKRKAENEILSLIVNHISFCIAFENSDKIISPAPEEYWQNFYEKMNQGKVKKETKLARRLNLTSQMPYRESRFNQICSVSG
jgi:hypothetical protein